jgi:hypothetical protein
MFKSLPTFVAALCLAGCPSLAGAADFLVDTGPGSFSLSSPLGPPSVGVVVGPQVRTHGEFTLAQAARITGIEFYGKVLTAGSGFFTINVDGGNEPGIFLPSPASFTFATATSEGWYGVTNIEDYELAAGTYWIGLANDGNTFTAQHFGAAPNGLVHESVYTPNPFPLGSYTDADSSNFAWRIRGTSLNAPIPSAVPEPATWAMMIAGFGLVGGSLRSARRGKLSALATF